jgi:hypothetical protein
MNDKSYKNPTTLDFLLYYKSIRIDIVYTSSKELTKEVNSAWRTQIRLVE